MKKRVLVAMSGGVDSSTAAALLVKQGYEVGGITMVLPDITTEGMEPGEKDRAAHDAKIVADHLGMEHHVVEINDMFQKNVIAYFVNEYKAGRTPNPCIQCNKKIKFGYLFDKALELGYDYLATGHYARIENDVLKKGLDTNKDQAYFLYILYNADMKRILFPNGNLKKEEIRNYARKLALPVAEREESQDICFIPDGDYTRFLEDYISSHTGNIVDIHGNILGTHSGIHKYTVGQRKGLGAYGQRMYVKEIRTETNTIVIATDEELQCIKAEVSNCIIGPFQISPGKKYQVRIRYRTVPVECVVKEYKDNRMVIELLKPVKGIAPGQAAVLYDEDVVIGGGTIERGFD